MDQSGHMGVVLQRSGFEFSACQNQLLIYLENLVGRVLLDDWRALDLRLLLPNFNLLLLGHI